MSDDETILSDQEQEWILKRCVSRLADNKEVQIYPMGAERYLASVLLGNQKGRYPLNTDIKGKDVLVIPGHGNSSFLFAQAGAKSITVYDKDPIMIAWMKAFKKYYHYRENEQYPSIGELFDALTCWYPPLISVPSGRFANLLFWILHPNSLRRAYIHYLISLVHQVMHAQTQERFELNKAIYFNAGTLEDLIAEDKKSTFDTAFVPYLLGVENGIEKEDEIVRFIEKMTGLIPQGNILVTPTQNTKEHRIAGRRYFVTTSYSEMQLIPGLTPYLGGDDKYWFHTQGLALFRAPKT